MNNFEYEYKNTGFISKNNNCFFIGFPGFKKRLYLQ